MNRELYKINVLGEHEQGLRVQRLQTLMREAGIAGALVRSNSNVYYLTGRVFRGFIYLSAESGSMPLYFVRQPAHLTDPRDGAVISIRKPEDIPPVLAARGVDTAQPLAMELDVMPWSEATRVAAAFGQTPALNISGLLRQCRSVKTGRELEMQRISGRKQTLVYERVPHLYREGMTDIEFQIEIERALRLEGCLGQFRVAGIDMELFMGNVLTGENADTPSPFDFAMGGAGPDPSLPVGADGTLIRPDMPVMVDMNGNFNGYMTDMTRMYVAGRVTEEAKRYNELSRRICSELASMMHPGAEAKTLYERALEIVRQAGAEEYFMGHRYHAGFVGHGIGIEVNELPVIAPRSRDVLQAGNTIALEPKFVVPGLGAVGVENTYVVHSDGPAEQITNAREDIMLLV